MILNGVLAVGNLAVLFNILIFHITGLELKALSLIQSL